jgi:hypothetical protein
LEGTYQKTELFLDHLGGDLGYERFLMFVSEGAGVH